MRIYQTHINVELNAEEVNGILTELKKLGKYQYINELKKECPNLFKLAANLPALDLPSQRVEF